MNQRLMTVADQHAAGELFLLLSQTVAYAADVHGGGRRSREVYHRRGKASF